MHVKLTAVEVTHKDAVIHVPIFSVYCVYTDSRLRTWIMENLDKLNIQQKNKHSELMVCRH